MARYWWRKLVLALTTGTIMLGLWAWLIDWWEGRYDLFVIGIDG